MLESEIPTILAIKFSKNNFVGKLCADIGELCVVEIFTKDDQEFV